MARIVDDHIINPSNDTIVISVDDEPGAGGANHRYVVSGFNLETNASASLDLPYQQTTILFQNGPINEFGVNGITQEVLLAIVADRLRSFQAGQFSCRENALALTKVEEALHWLQQRTIRRLRAGVEGTGQMDKGDGESSK